MIYFVKKRAHLNFLFFFLKKLSSYFFTLLILIELFKVKQKHIS